MNEQTEQTVDQTKTNSTNTALFRHQSVLHKQSYTYGTPDLAPPLSGWVVCAVCILMLISLSFFLFFAKYTHRERVSGELTPASGIIEISSPDDGIVKQIYVDDGAYVLQGQTLAVVQKDKKGADLVTTSSNDNTSFNLQIKNLQKSINNIDMQLEEKHKEKSSHINLINAKKHHVQIELRLNKQLLSKQQILVQHMAELESISAVSNLEAQAQIEKLTTFRANSEKLENEYLTLNQDLININQQYTQLSIDSDIKKNSLEKDILKLKRLLKNSDINSTFTITAPKNGRILALKTLEGQFASKNQPLLLFTTRDQTLVAELFVPDRTIPFIKLNDKVNLKYNSFPYQKFGQYHGKIKSISSIPIIPIPRHSSSSTDQTFYKVTLTLDQQNLVINNSAIPLKPGYTLEAEIMTESHSLLDWIFYEIFKD
ncbi:HlyD family secretion protein [Pseudomonas sp. 25 E 4]|uniref:HlyD family secretion protein n=1 Tax=Pseudomonas sp. 25 E 4 TaxID=1844097 RepID=UPI00081264C2|nr:HlyD family efflux transporter periplasmic adaptor subunit [Pseudomonas sp. 25 E 4]CRM12366.1 Colicin V secretion protein CvaA [Pseudomonas sp. 25 E 4]